MRFQNLPASAAVEIEAIVVVGCFCHSTGGMAVKLRYGLSVCNDIPIAAQLIHGIKGRRDERVYDSLSHTHFGLSTRRRESLGFFTQSRLHSPSSGLDQQSADWCTITTSVQTEANSDANLPLWAQCGESRDLASTSASGFACVCTVCLYLQILLGGFCDLSTLYALYFHGDSLRIPRGI